MALTVTFIPSACLNCPIYATQLQPTWGSHQEVHDLGIGAQLRWRVVVFQELALFEVLAASSGLAHQRFFSACFHIMRIINLKLEK